jgi:transposase
MANDQQSSGRRQRRTIEEKREIVEETLAPGASVSVVARRHDVNANQLFGWRRQYRCGELGNGTTLVSVGVIGQDSIVSADSGRAKPKPAQPPAPRCAAPGCKQPKMIEVELGCGTRIRVDADVRAPVLQQVLKLIRALA